VNTQTVELTAQRLPPQTSEYRKLFIIGCPRSGTTWVQLLLSQHATTATAPETQIFAYYIEQLRRQWKHEHAGVARKEQGGAGLSRLLDEPEFDELCRNAARFVLDRIAARRPGAEIVVEKSPKHALCADYIARLFPDACFLHVVRDPRDTCASLIDAAATWGRGWAPRNAIEAARMWRTHVEAARRVSGDRERYREVQYEVLRTAPALELRKILAWLGINESIETCEEAVRACEFGRLQTAANHANLPLPAARSPEGFFRKGKAGGWRDDLAMHDVVIIEYICRELMIDLGYERTTKAARQPLRVVAHDFIARIRESIDWQLERLLRAV
jgi:hypothetical protein